MPTVQLRAVFFREGENWVAQCLEHDIAAQAATLPELSHRLRQTIAAELHFAQARGVAPFEGIVAAPDHFVQMYDRAEMRVTEDAAQPGPAIITKLAA
jgi:hypothetical protein